MRAPGGAGLRALPDPAEPEPGACREPGSRPRGIGGRPADRSSSFGRRFHGQGPWSAAGASGIRCEDATVGVVIPRFRCAKSPASMPDALTGGQRACSTYGDRVRPEPTPVIRIVSITGPPARPAQRILLCWPPASSARGRCSAMCPAAARFVAPGIRAAMRTFRPAGPRARGPAGIMMARRPCATLAAIGPHGVRHHVEKHREPLRACDEAAALVRRGPDPRARLARVVHGRSDLLRRLVQ